MIMRKSPSDIALDASDAVQIAASFDGRCIEILDLLTRAPALNVGSTATLVPSEAVDLSDALNSLRDAFIRYETALLAADQEEAA